MPEPITVPLDTNSDGRSATVRDMKRQQQLERIRQSALRRQQARTQESEYQRTLAARSAMFQAETVQRGAQPQVFAEPTRPTVFARPQPTTIPPPVLGQTERQRAEVFTRAKLEEEFAPGRKPGIGEYITGKVGEVAQKGVETFGATIYETIRTAGNPFSPDASKSSAERQRRYQEWKSPPGVKGALETVPWLLVPGAQQTKASLLTGATKLAAKGDRASLAASELLKAAAATVAPVAGAEQAVGEVAGAGLRAGLRGAKAIPGAAGRYAERLIETGGVSAGIPAPRVVTAARAGGFKRLTELYGPLSPVKAADKPGIPVILNDGRIGFYQGRRPVAGGPSRLSIRLPDESTLELSSSAVRKHPDPTDWEFQWKEELRASRPEAPLAAGQAEMPVAAKEPWQGTVYRGVSRLTPVDKGHFGQGATFSTKVEVARNYAGGEGKLIQGTVKLENPYIIDATTSQGIMEAEAFAKTSWSGTTADLKAQGYDGVVVKGWHGTNGDEVVVFYPEKSFTETDLVRPAAPPAVEAVAPSAARPAAEVPAAAPIIRREVAEAVPPTAAVVPPVKPPVPPGVRGARPGMPGRRPPEGFAANIRLSKYPEDIRATIKEWADANPAAVQAARRGVRSDAQVLEDARKLVNDLGGDFEKLVKRWEPGQAWNAEEITALRGAEVDAVRGLANARAAIQAGIDTTENHLRMVEAITRRAQIQAAVHGVSAEAGRTLRAHRLLAMEGLQTRDVVKMKAILDRLEGRVKPEELAKALEYIDLDNPAQVSAFIRQYVKPRWWEYPLEVVINAYLSGPTSHAINALSNAGMVSISPVRRALAATVEAGMAPLQGRTRQRFFAEVPADIIGAFQGIPEGTRSFLYVMRRGVAPTEMAKYELPRIPAFTGRPGVVVHLPSRLMHAADQLFYHINYRAAINAEAVRMARISRQVGKSDIERTVGILANPPTEMMERARVIAERNLFRNEPGAFVKSIMSLREKELLGVPWGRFLMPFVRTPGNLLTTGLAHSPAGLASPAMWRALLKKDPAFADKMAEVILGTGLAMAVTVYFAKGNITGAAPTNPAERDAFYRAGKLPYAVKIGGTWVQYRRLEPFNTAFTLIAGVVAAVEAGDEADALAKAGIVVSSLGKNFLDQPYMTGLASIIDAMEDPERSGTRFLQRLVAGFVPYSSLQRQTEAMLEPTYRQPETFGERLKAQTPGMAGQVPPRLTAFGEEAQRTSPAMFPIAWSQVRKDEVEAELTRLGINIGFVGKTVGGKKLSREEQQRYQVLAGQATYQALAALIPSVDYQNLNDVGKERAINRVIDNAREQARYMVTREGISTAPTTFPMIGRGAGIPTPTSPPGSADAESQARLERIRATMERRKTPTPVPVGAAR